jgi:hypothetical protein
VLIATSAIQLFAQYVYILTECENANPCHLMAHQQTVCQPFSNRNKAVLPNIDIHSIVENRSRMPIRLAGQYANRHDRSYSICNLRVLRNPENKMASNLLYPRPIA